VHSDDPEGREALKKFIKSQAKLYKAELNNDVSETL